MKQLIREFIPNAFTLANLFCGSMAIIISLSNAQEVDLNSAFLHSVYFILASMLLDFFDGFVARALNVQSELGVQLDSLADMVSFGLFPSLVLYKLFQLYQPENYNLSWLGLLVALGACYRLARFNIDATKTTYFKGLATPAMAFFVIGIASLIFQYLSLTNVNLILPILIFCSVLLPYMMNSSLPLFSLKDKKKGFANNWHVIALLVLSLAGLFWLQFSAFAIIIPLYIILSLIARKNFV